MTKSPLNVVIAETAAIDVADILERSERRFGHAAKLRYEELIAQAVKDIGVDPERAGSRKRPDLMINAGRTYHLEFSRKNVTGTSVQSPRHFLIYRYVSAGVIEVGRVLHDSRDLSRHLPSAYRL